jgi:hypothetical protein
MVTESYPQGSPTRQNFFMSCMDIRMDFAYSSTHRGNGSQRKGKKMKLVATDTKVTIKWFVYTGNNKIRHNSTMRGNWGWDAECSCGWMTRTGGASKPFVQFEVNYHKKFDHNYIYDFHLDYSKISTGKAGA